MKKTLLSLFAVMLMTLTANAEKTITWDYNTIKGINFSYQDYEISDNYSIFSKDGITMFALTGNWSITGLTHSTWFQDCTLGSNTTLFEHDEIYFRSAIGRITSITITCSDGERTIYDANYYGWTTSQFSVSWTGEPSNEVIMPLKQHSEIEGITKIIFTVDDVCKYKVYWSEDYNVTPGTEVEKGTTLVFTPIDPSRGKINSLKICDNRGLEYYINLTDNGDGTWSLPAMPDYDVYLYDIIDKYYAIDNTPKSWSINGNPPGDFYSAEEGKEIVVKPYCLNGKVIKSIKVVDYALENVTYFTNNGDGTWTLAAMPGYNVIMVVEYEDIPEVYTYFDEGTGTLTYYYDTKREERTGVTEVYDPVGNPDAVRFTGYYKKVKKAVIDPSMKQAPLTSMYSMFFGGINGETFAFQVLSNMTEVKGMENLNTAKVTRMDWMFEACNSLQTIDVSSFDVSKVTKMDYMFGDCYKLTTIYCNDDWSNTSASSFYMFATCTSLVGGKGTTFDSEVKDKTYARPDGGPSAPGYFTEKPSLQGDLNGDGKVDIADAVTVLNIMAAGEYNASADLNGDGKDDIADFVTILNIMAAQ